MKLQNFEQKNNRIREEFEKFIGENKVGDHLKLSWSNWGFGLEPIEESLKRLSKYNIKYIEIHGNRYGSDLGYNAKKLNKLLKNFGIKVSGVCGMVWEESELSSPNPFIRQRCIDYFKRNVELCKDIGGEYILFSPAAIGRPEKYDDFEFERVVETLKILGDVFLEAGVKAALEPVRADEVSLCNKFEDAVKIIDAVNHKGVRHIAGDVYHMFHHETHIGETLLNYGDYLINLHLADTNRKALGSGMLDLDIIIMSLYLIGYNTKRAFVSAEPLGPSSNPYYQRYGITKPEILNKLVSDTASYFYEREKILLEGVLN
jgi:D-psicose/D-tagatose/L-ribulose 3-epimerase